MATLYHLSYSMTTAAFVRKIKQFYKENGREMPWRETRDPYKIVVSEIMLQQTQVDRVKIKYESFLKKFPTWEKLSVAPIDAVLREWQGLGYNRRALFLKRMAEKVVTEYGSQLPRKIEEMTKLPGIGKATASAVAAYAFNIPSAYIETNIRSVYLHEFFPGKEAVHDKELFPLIEKTLDLENPREWYWALMDYGSHLKKTNPNPSRKSKHHTKQSKLKGSLREARGKILKLLGEKPHTEKELEEMSEIQDGRIEFALGALIKEGFIQEKRGKYHLGN